jgi:hypothetical protein
MPTVITCHEDVTSQSIDTFEGNCHYNTLTVIYLFVKDHGNVYVQYALLMTLI